eukprot:515014-Pelagomonas_calceolata.AAC.1
MVLNQRANQALHEAALQTWEHNVTQQATRGLSEQVSNPVQTALHEADNGNQGSEGHQAGSMMHGSNKRKRGVACFTSLCWLVGLMWAVT